jgi:hypothetical protein
MRKIVTISSKNKRPLNALSDYLLDQHAELIERLEGFELIAGGSQILGSGDAPVESIKITALIHNPDKKAKSVLDELIKLLTEKADELDIEITYKVT